MSPEILVTTPRHPLPGGRLTLLGAVDRVTGAATLLELGAAKLLIDCGVAQGGDAAGWSFPEEALSASAVILTHGHLDHVGGLPTLFERGFTGPVFATRATHEIAESILRDSLSLGGWSERQARSFIAQLRERRRVVPLEEPFAPAGLEGHVTFREAGHILGSASVDVETPAARVIVSGDLGRPDSPILRDFNRVWGERPADLVVLESTYGDRLHDTSPRDVERDLERILTRAIARGGHILMPTFAIGRTQTLLYHLNTLVEAGRIPKVPVAVDTPLGLRITETYASRADLYDEEALGLLTRGDDPLSFDDLYAVRRGADSARLREAPGPFIVLAGSGMVTGGRIVAHMRALLPRPETTVVFAGFQAPGTPGRAILEGGRVTLDGEQVEVRAHVEVLSGLSAHADQRELLEWLGHIPAPKRVALHHGSPAAQEGLARAFSRASADGFARDVAPPGAPTSGDAPPLVQPHADPDRPGSPPHAKLMQS